MDELPGQKHKFLFLQKFILGLCYQYGLGVERNPGLGLQYYNESVAVAHTKTLLELAPVYNQIGICHDLEADLDKMPERAIYFYRKSAELQFSLALYNLGSCYSNGVGVEKNYTLAVEYFKQSVRLKNPIALSEIGFHYWMGFGVKGNRVKAVKYFRLSAAQGFP